MLWLCPLLLNYELQVITHSDEEYLDIVEHDANLLTQIWKSLDQNVSDHHNTHRKLKCGNIRQPLDQRLSKKHAEHLREPEHDSDSKHVPFDVAYVEYYEEIIEHTCQCDSFQF